MLQAKWIGVEKFTKDVEDKLLVLKGMKGGDRTKANAQAVVVLDGWIKRNFQEQGRKAEPGGWQDLKPETLLRRRKGKKKSLSDQILIDRGNLRNDWKHLYTRVRAAIQSRQIYSRVHDQGYPKRNIPKRPILPTRKQIWPSIAKVYRAFIRKVL